MGEEREEETGERGIKELGNENMNMRGDRQRDGEIEREREREMMMMMMQTQRQTVWSFCVCSFFLVISLTTEQNRGTYSPSKFEGD